ncbi:MAG TPA: hypothetical protein PLH37_02235 [bacterium]|nr:hypothetical protein [bacterium]
MRLSSLQKFILLECLNANSSAGGGKISRGRLNKFYDNVDKKPQVEMMTKIVTQSIERLIEKDLLIGFGERTKYKWFIKEIKLTRQGKRETQKLMGQQMKLPFRHKK